MPEPVRPSRAAAGPRQRSGQYRHKRSITDIGLAMLTPLVGQRVPGPLPPPRPAQPGPQVRGRRCFPPRAPPPASSRRSRGRQAADPAVHRRRRLLRPHPDDDQKMIVETVSEFAEEILRPAARDADAAATTGGPDRQGRRTRHHRDQRAGGLRRHRRTPLDGHQRVGGRGAQPTATWVGAADPGPGGVASALTHWGSADQQATYLAEFAGQNVPQACVAIVEPHALFDPTALRTTAVRTPSGYRLGGQVADSPPRTPNCSSSQHNSTAGRRCSSSRPTPRA